MIQSCEGKVHTLVLIPHSWLLTFYNEIPIPHNEIGIYQTDFRITHL
jgi:hypothetical protein